jgi:hypothetical protein
MNTNADTVQTLLTKEFSSIVQKAAKDFANNNSAFLEDREYLANGQYKASGDCLRDRIKEGVNNCIKASGVDDWLAWGEYLRQEEISFNSILVNNFLLPDSSQDSYLPKRIGGVDIIVTNHDSIGLFQKYCKSKDYDGQKTCYVAGNQNQTQAFNEATICIEIKVLHFNKNISDLCEGMSCNESQYFLGEDHWNNTSNTPSPGSFEFTQTIGIEQRMTCNCSGQFLSDIAKGLLYLQNQSSINNMYIGGVIVGKGRYPFAHNPKEIHDRMVQFVAKLYKKGNLFYLHNGSYIEYVPELLANMRNTCFRIGIGSREQASKEKKGQFIYPYSVVLTKSKEFKVT